MRILYIDIDTLRPDHLGCYGYHRNTSPNIDEIAGEACRFDQCYVSDAPCMPSRAAGWGGRFGINSGLINHGGFNAEYYPEGSERSFQWSPNRDTFTRVLQRNGMHTVSFSTFAERHSSFWFCNGFNEMVNMGKAGDERADEIVPDALDWLDRKGDRDNWFMHVNVWDPHTMFRTPEDYGNPFEDKPVNEWLSEDLRCHHWNSYGPHNAQEVSFFMPIEYPQWPRHLPQIKDMTDFKKWIDGYDTGIWYADMWIGKIIDKLKMLGVYEDTIIMISSDHGENHGEIGVYGDHQTACHVTCRVPFLLRVPGETKTGTNDAALHYQSDIFATVLDLLGHNIPGEWDGDTFADSWLQGESEGHPYVVTSNGAWSCQRGVRWDNWMLLRTYHTGYKAFPEYMLFDVENDYHMTVNLAVDRPDIVREGIFLLEKWIVENLRRNNNTTDPMYEVMQEGGSWHANDHISFVHDYFDRLRHTGRRWLGDWLEQSGGHPIPEGAPWAAALLPGQKPLAKPYEGQVGDLPSERNGSTKKVMTPPLVEKLTKKQIKVTA